MKRFDTFALSMALFISAFANAGQVKITNDRLSVDDKEVPFLFGAEIQYFRARGGSGRNVPAADVHALWNKMLDRVVEAGMNTVTFYIPWDFHEPVEGTFDFDGTLDQDKDGKPDYPSRNLKLFFKLLADRKLEHLMVRPGPYINAEWGPEGFGAVPKWFLDRYPGSLNQTLSPNKPRTVSFYDSTFREKTVTWFTELHRQVLKDHIGPGKPASFLQLDNETNYFWDTVYERDRKPESIKWFREFAALKYNHDVKRLSLAYGAPIAGFDALVAPVGAGDEKYPLPAWHYDWFQFHDEEIRDYYVFLRRTWEALGVNEPNVLFTSCDSFNAFDNGLLPRLDYRGENKLTFSTMNIYPKTEGNLAKSTLNNPMKGAHDAILMSAAHRQFYGTGGDWLMSTETMGGWFPPVEVSLDARQHTYGSLLATGVKALIIYYMHEGWNWTGTEGQDTELRFDAPLDKDMNARAAFQLLKELGAALKKGMGDFLVTGRADRSPVLVAHDSETQYPLSGVNAIKKASTDSASLFGLLREAGYLPEVAYLDRMSDEELLKFKAIFWDHPGYISERSEGALRRFLSMGGWLVWMGSGEPPALPSERIIRLARNPALGWNEDSYLNLKGTAAILAEMKSLLKSMGLNPLVEVSADNQKPYVHAWTRTTSRGRLVAVENFSREARKVSVKLPLEKGKNTSWKRLWGNDSAKGAFEIASKDLEEKGAPLDLKKDSIELWQVTVK